MNLFIDDLARYLKHGWDRVLWSGSGAREARFVVQGLAKGWVDEDDKLTWYRNRTAIDEQGDGLDKNNLAPSLRSAALKLSETYRHWLQHCVADENDTDASTGLPGAGRPRRCGPVTGAVVRPSGEAVRGGAGNAKSNPSWQRDWNE